MKRKQKTPMVPVPCLYFQNPHFHFRLLNTSKQPVTVDEGCDISGQPQLHIAVLAFDPSEKERSFHVLPPHSLSNSLLLAFLNFSRSLL